MINRVVLLVIDSVGIGYLPDAEKYGDYGANTLGNIALHTGGISLPNMRALGLGNIDEVKGVEPVADPTGAFGRANEFSSGKDTTTGHWEMTGLYVEEPFNTFPNGFSEEIIKEFEKRIGRKTLANYAASGTVIIEDLGEKHLETGYPIVYTSADSVFQIAAHEDIISIPELYKMCEIARELMMGENAVARIIARPFDGELGSFQRTTNRKDYSLDPTSKTVLDLAKNEGLDVIGIGKIEDIFNSKGITSAIHTKSNMSGVDATIESLNKESKGIIFTNLVDFDAKYGHRRNPEGYKDALEEFDKRVPDILASLKDDDVLIITADHGNDPTFKGTDHTREYVPLLVYGKKIKNNVNLGTRKSFADIARTISEFLRISNTGVGESFAALARQGDRDLS
ncbi:MAG: phosphopentomutase [Alkaliphilus sp.]|nr:phosphopentomutase [Alkaliphilus sp. AH-315-G20]PHS36533.1 MAG: phosphopentomutase [Alkaliphilus sp.]